MNVAVEPAYFGHLIDDNAKPFYVETTDEVQVRYYFHPRNPEAMVVATYNRRTTSTRYAVRTLPRSMR